MIEKFEQQPELKDILEKLSRFSKLASDKLLEHEKHISEIYEALEITGQRVVEIIEHLNKEQGKL